MEEKKLTAEEVVRALEEMYEFGRFTHKTIKLIYLLKAIIDDKKAEIERLTEEYCKVLNDWDSTSKYACRLSDENDKMTYELRLYKNAHKSIKRNAGELQKQVDELKEQRDVFKNLFESCNNSSITTVEIINAMNSFYREQAEHLAELKIEQAVKDTVTKYHNAIRKRAHYSWLSDFHEFMRILAKIEKEEFGVEVE